MESSNINSYIIKWMGKVVVDGVSTKFVDVNSGVPHGTVL